MKRQIDNYYIRGVVGNPQESRVFLVEEKETEKPFALKALPMDFFNNDREFRGFAQLIEKVGQFKSPHLVAHYKLLGKYTEPFLLTEYVDGMNLRTYSDNERRPFPELLGVALQILKGLQYLHHHKVLHQNLKSTNVLLDSDLNVKLTDFHFSKIHGRWRKRRGFTSIESVKYLSPEQVKGKSLDERSDTYSAGVILFYLFTQVMPIRGTSQAEIMQKHVRMNVVEVPSTINPDVPPGVSRIIMDMLQKKPKKRLASLSELILDFTRMEQSLQKHMGI